MKNYLATHTLVFFVLLVLVLTLLGASQILIESSPALSRLGEVLRLAVTRQ